MKNCSKFDPNYKNKKQNQNKSDKQSAKDDNKAEKSKKDDQNKKDKNNHNYDYDDEDCVAEEESNLIECSQSRWIIDCGSTCHMTNDKSDFVSYTKLDDPRKIKFGGQECGLGIGLGRVKVISVVEGVNKEVYLSDVLYVPVLRRKLISLSAAAKRGCQGNWYEDKLVLRGKKGDIKIIAKEYKGLYFADIKYDMLTENSESEDLEEEGNVAEANLNAWHEGFCHLNHKSLIKSAKAVKGLEELIGSKMITDHNYETIRCTGCTQGKLPKKSIQSRTAERAREIGERVHFDIGGPIGAKTYDNMVYYILFKDEYSSFRFVHLLNSRKEASDKIRLVVAHIAADTKNKVRYLISDCGSEFTSNRSQEFFIEKGIVHLKAAPFTPAQNGLIERDNRTLMNGVRAMLLHRNVPELFWGEAMKTLVYVLNRSVNSSTKNKTPYELYFGKVPKVNHLKIFGCICYVKTQTKKRSGYQKKIEERGLKSIFVGYEGFDYTYRVYDLENKKIIVSRDVVFDETKGFVGDISHKGIDSYINLRGESNESMDSNSDYQSEEEVEISEEKLSIPQNYKEALQSPQAKMWIEAMNDEYKSLIDNQTWDVVDLPEGRRAITGKWVYALKKKNGLIDRFKARYVARGFTQKPGIDFKETFSPVVRMESIRILLILANHFDPIVMQIDVKTAFLHSDLEENIFMRQPDGFVTGKPGQVCRLKKAIYGLKQASLSWNKYFSNFLKKFNLISLKCDTCIFINTGTPFETPEKPILIVALYVDDGLILSNNKILLKSCIKYLKSKFEIKIGKAENFVGIQISRTKDTLLMNQTSYI